jgi:5-methylcytosine-specific restriction endonuclease McrA
VIRRNISTTERVGIFYRAGGVCHLCGEKIGLAERWDVEHVIPLEMGGDEAKGSTNLQPAHVACHKTKTSVDSWQIAKAKRREAKHLGARPPSRLGHPTLKRKIDGTVVPK